MTQSIGFIGNSQEIQKIPWADGDTYIHMLPTLITNQNIRQTPFVSQPTKDDLIIALDAEYAPQFDALTLAWATASMDGDTVTANARLADKTALRAEYQAKREAIING